MSSTLFRGARVFITGATGFLGGALARVLAQQGAEVHALARSSADRSLLNGTVQWHDGDITTRNDRIFDGATHVIHAAGRLGEAGVPDEVYHRVNVEGTRNVLNAALAATYKPRVLHLSSPGVLGPTTREPASEAASYHPTTAYERSKVAAEQVALEFVKQGLPVVIARPGFIYGPGDRHVLKLFQAINRGRFFLIDGGQHLCQPTYVADAVQGMLLCLGRGQPGESYHIAGPQAVTFRELADTIADAVGVPRPGLAFPRWAAMAGASVLEWGARIARRPPPLSRNGVAFFSEDRLFSCQKACDQLGYEPRHDLVTGVVCTVDWYRRRGWL